MPIALIFNIIFVQRVIIKKFTNNINRTVFYLDIKYNPFAENIFLKTDPCARLGYFYSYITGSFLTENSQIFSRGAITNIFRTEHP